ncbi:hypothetical protein BVU17_08140 [Haloarcula taiwanensis]|uniref:Uncharacterized protein n=1 Tax=Haloarcula taiwanensis TaxID=1932004 RepID=A0A2H4ZYI7_9EURY|nr:MULTISPECIES: hypothetical protein [Haloarcula]AUG47487.1 hypothetical protein BVU17_08140 [Haloarcula taiwanensis]KZX48737.1 hypothetical protein AV929_07195 [Haloarcula sp. K1]RLM33841.1 hypothetical protein DVK01_15245 [Haloarcula sp. Atlit-120R]RLM42599.1 hypothetical protein DVK00_16210 [Haloarcula sp. Atlit-47R]RLM95872.1 hypothetical protein D3D01_10895 [Haloarcula sp. Atlit-7R]
MVISTEPAWGEAVEQFVKEHKSAIVYADIEQETVLHEGAVRVLANGWVELPTGRLLSPDAVHHIDTQSG